MLEFDDARAVFLDIRHGMRDEDERRAAGEQGIDVSSDWNCNFHNGVVFKSRVFAFDVGSNERITDGSSSIFMSAKRDAPASLSEAPICQTVLSVTRKRSCDFL